jgi:hypothetical protein
VVFAPTQVNQRAGSLTITGTGLSVPLVVPLSGSGASFTMKAIGSSSQVITGGEAPQPFQIEIDSVSGSTGPVALTCAVVPATASCAVSPASVTLTGGSSQFAIVNFSDSQARIVPSSGKAAAILALLLPLGFLGRARRRWRAVALCAFLGLLFPVGCGVSASAGSATSTGGQSSGAGSSGLYTITLTGSMPGLAQTVSLQVTQQ